MGNSEVGLLATQYSILFADSISTASFNVEPVDVDKHDARKVVDVDNLRSEFVCEYKLGNVIMATHPLMRRFCDTELCDPNHHVEMAKVALAAGGGANGEPIGSRPGPNQAY